MLSGATSSGLPSPWRTYLARGLSGPDTVCPMEVVVVSVPSTVDDSPMVPVRSMLRPSTYRAIASRAKELGVEVSTVLSRLADRAVASPEPRRAAPVPVGPARPPGDAIDRRIVELNAERLNESEIARVIGMHQTAVSRRRRLMGLVSRGRAER